MRVQSPAKAGSEPGYRVHLYTVHRSGIARNQLPRVVRIDPVQLRSEKRGHAVATDIQPVLEYFHAPDIPVRKCRSPSAEWNDLRERVACAWHGLHRVCFHHTESAVITQTQVEVAVERLDL